MALRIKVSSSEFEAACTDGCAYGRIQGKQDLYVYAELGEEREYRPMPQDNPRTEYRIFTSCDAYFAKTAEQLRQGELEAEYLSNITVIIYH